MRLFDNNSILDALFFALITEEESSIEKRINKISSKRIFIEDNDEDDRENPDW